MKPLLTTLCLILLTAPGLRADNGVKAGQFVVEPPTLICLGFEWEITGDDNRNATVEVELPAGRDRARGSRDAAAADGRREDLPRARTPCRDRFAGSILDLEPDTEYEVRLTMKDPDGVDRAGGADGEGAHARASRRRPPADACCTSIRRPGGARSRSRTSPA